MKHSLRQVGKKYIFSVRDLMPDDAGLYQLDVEGVNMFSTDFKSKFYTFREDKLVHQIKQFLTQKQNDPNQNKN